MGDLSAWQVFTDIDYPAAVERWERNNRNFGSAYEIAKEWYFYTLTQQKEADKAAAENRAQLAMLAISLAGGSLLIAAFGKAALSDVASEFVPKSALKKTVQGGWSRTANTLAWAGNSPVGKLVLGKVWEREKAALSEKVKSKIAGVETQAKVSKGTFGMEEVDKIANRKKIDRVGNIKGPVEFGNDLKNYLGEYKIAVKNTAYEYYSRPDGDNELAKFQRNSPFFSAPVNPVDKGKLAWRIELAFWMKYTLDQDYIAGGKWIPVDPRDFPGAVRNGIKLRKRVWVTNPSVPDIPIHTSPTSKDYPRPKDAFLPSASYNEVGSIVRKRIDLAYRNAFGGELPFFKPDIVCKYPDGRYKGNCFANASRVTLENAERQLRRLSKINAREIKTMMSL